MRSGASCLENPMSGGNMLPLSVNLFDKEKLKRKGFKEFLGLNPAILSSSLYFSWAISKYRKIGNAWVC